MMETPQLIPQMPSEEDIQKRKKIEKEVIKVIQEMQQEVEFILSSGPHREYFLGQEDKRQKLKEISSKYNSSIQLKLLSQIQKGQTTVSKNKTSYHLERKAPLNAQQMIQLTKKQLMMKKKHAVQALSDILKEQSDLIKQQRSILAESRSMVKRLHIDENPEWKSDLALALKKQRQLDRSIQIKDKQAEKKVKQIKEDQIKANKQRLERQRSMNIKILQSRKQRQSILKLHEKQSIEKCSGFIHKNKPKKYRFQIMSERGEQKLKELESEREQKIRQYKQMRQKRDWAGLKEHQEKYFKTLSERKQQWILKFQTSLSRADKRHEQSIFAERLKQAESEKQLREKQRENKKRQFLERIKEYGASVLQNHMPRSFVKSSQEASEDTKKHTRQSLNRMQERQKGLLFLNEAKKHRKLTSDAKNSNLQAATSLPSIKLPAYKDYLKQQPRRMQKTSFQTVLAQRKGEWASNAKSLLEKIDVSHKINKRNDKSLVQSAFKKIELLNAIM